jgi:aryl-alcohol dehydrogenase-like predicted oxidoreductase
MNYRTLPGTGISVSNLALGTMGFGTGFVEANGNLATPPTSPIPSPFRHGESRTRTGDTLIFNGTCR